MDYVPSKHMLADIFTKALPRDKFVYLRTACGLVLHQPGRSVGISSETTPKPLKSNDVVERRENVAERGGNRKRGKNVRV